LDHEVAGCGGVMRRAGQAPYGGSTVLLRQAMTAGLWLPGCLPARGPAGIGSTEAAGAGG
jgi:hypothetical protein